MAGWSIDSWPAGVPLDIFVELDSYSWLWITTTGGIDVSGHPVNSLFKFILGPELAGDFASLEAEKFYVTRSLDGLNMYVNYSFNVIPEPSTLLLTSLAMAGLGAFGWRRRNRPPKETTP